MSDRISDDGVMWAMSTTGYTYALLVMELMWAIAFLVMRLM
jgi:hypothetical protein